MRIVAETKRPVVEQAPPASARLHAWSSGQRELPSVFVEARAAREVEAQVLDGQAKGHEVLGLLAGDRFRTPGGALIAMATAAVTSPLSANSAHVRFEATKFEELAGSLDRLAFDFLIVGWYHSHLDHGCFLSPTDVSTQRRYFSAPHQFGWVLDPVRRESAAFRVVGSKGQRVGLRVFDSPPAVAPPILLDNRPATNPK